MTIDDSKQGQMEGLATLLVLDAEIRKLTSVREFGFFSTNETHRLIPYHTAFLWQQKEFIGVQLAAQSGAAEVDVHAPTNQWVLHKINQIRSSETAKKIHQINKQEESKENNSSHPWPEDLPDYLLWCPFLSKSNNLTGGLLLFRDTAFSENEVKMLYWLIESFQYTWQQFQKPHKIEYWKKYQTKPYMIAGSVILLGILCFPVRLSVLGDGTVSAKSPMLINAPIQGVIKSFAVSPGDSVKKGQLLLELDKTDLRSAAEVSQKDFLLTQAKFRTAVNEGFEKKESRSEIPIIKAQLEIDKARAEYANAMLEKTNIYAPADGIVVFESKEDWVGQPVKAGEKIMTVANLNDVQLKISLPVSNSMKLSVGGKGEFFPYGQLNPLPVKIRILGYNAKMMPSHILAYQLVADFIDSNKLPQLGTQGTVKLYGHYVPFFYYVIRRPIQAIRQNLGI